MTSATPCLSSTCQQYEECVGTKSTDECKSDVLGQALEEATIIIPLYRQGRDCLRGNDPEACGAIAALSLGLVEEGASRLTKREFGEATIGKAQVRKPLTKDEFEEATIREAIGRPRAADPVLRKRSKHRKRPRKPHHARAPSQSHR
jgi:hypothetical protein